MASPRDAFNLSRKNASYARAVGSYVPGLTRKSFEKYGFSTATLLTDWPIIAGRELASFTLPERLKWPRHVDAFEETAADRRGRPGATLVLRVDGPRAVELQYQTVQIMERINAHFGYRAVSEVRFIQAPLPKNRPGMEAAAQRTREKRPTECAASPGPRCNAATSAGEVAPQGPDRLLAALDRLQANMTRARSI